MITAAIDWSLAFAGAALVLGPAGIALGWWLNQRGDERRRTWALEDAALQEARAHREWERDQRMKGYAEMDARLGRVHWAIVTLGSFSISLSDPNVKPATVRWIGTNLGIEAEIPGFVQAHIRMLSLEYTGELYDALSRVGMLATRSTYDFAREAVTAYRKALRASTTGPPSPVEMVRLDRCRTAFRTAARREIGTEEGAATSQVAPAAEPMVGDSVEDDQPDVASP